MLQLRNTFLLFMSGPMMSEVSRILLQMESGDRFAAERLLVLIYDELRALAAAKLASEKPGQTLDATALVHEAFVRLAGKQTFADRLHFFRLAAEAMRRILIDRARLFAQSGDIAHL